MGNRRISRDVKIAALNLYEQGHLSVKEILACVGFSRSTFFRVLHLWRTTGDVVRPQNRTGRPRLLHRDDVQHLVELIHYRPDWFLDELLKLLKTNRFISVHYTTIHRELERAGMSAMKLTEIAEERCEPSRQDYIREVSQYPPDYLGFLDETSKNDKTPGRRLGRAKKGKRAVKRRKAVRGRRLTATGFLTSHGMLTSTVVEGSMYRDQYLGFLEHSVLPLCSRYPGPLSVLVMDNARIHHGEEILELCNRFGVRLVYLPPYSPDLNPIEEAFSKIKAWIRRNNDIFSYGPDDEPHSLIYDMLEAMNIVTESDAIGYFIHAGYF